MNSFRQGTREGRQGRSRRTHVFAAMLLALVAVMGLSGCSSSAPSGPLEVATVNGHGIALDDYTQILAYAEAASTQSGPYNWQSSTGRGNASSLQTQVVQFLVNLELMREALSDQHVSVSAKELQVAEKQFDDNLKAGEASSDPTTKDTIAAELPYVTGRVRYLIAEQTAMEAKLISVLNLWTVHLHDFAVSSKTQADSLLSQLQAGGDFTKLASQTNPNITDGGDYGTAWFGGVPAEFSTALFGANPDKDTPPQYSEVAYNGEYVLVQVTDKQQQRLSTDTDATDQSNIFSSWLQQVYTVKSHQETFIYIPPAATQQVTQG